MKKTARSLFLAIVASAMLLPVFALQHELIGERDAIQLRALLAPDTSAASSPESSAAAPTSTQAATSAAPSTAATTAAAATSSAGATSAVSSPAASAAPTHASSAPAPSTSEAPATSVVPTTATNSAGQIVTSYVITTPTTSDSSSAPSHTGSSDDSSSGGLSTGSIVGLSVSGGIAAVGIILFFVWKFTRKRFADFDDNEAIKWPELNAHSNDVHALPTNSTGRSGFGPENDSDINLTRPPSPNGAYANSIAASSVPEIYGTGDPYAVPPLPHLNPNQPYHDEPSAYGQAAGYYDPYRGPVPNTFDNMSDGHGTEAIPMTQMARIRSPGPQMAYDMQGRSSPAPQAAMGYAGADERSRTPIPGALGSGRASPSPHPGYGYGSR